MNTPNNERPPLKPISVSGTYKLKLIRPKGTDKVKVWEDGTASCRLMFLDDAGNCLWKTFSTKWAKPFAMLVGKFSGNFTKEIRIDATPAEYLQYIDGAVGKTCVLGVEVQEDGVHPDNTPRFKYKLTYPRGSQKPVVNDLPNPEDVPY